MEVLRVTETIPQTGTTLREGNIMKFSWDMCSGTIWALLATAVLAVTLSGNVAAQEEEAAPAAAVEEAAPAAAASVEEEGAYSSDEYIASEGYSTFTVNNLWICISAALVFIMHLGFTTLESGLTQQKNAVNIIFKNVWIVCTGILLYAFWGFNAMYPGDFNGYFAMGSWFGQSLNDTSMTTEAYNAGYTWWGDFIFQAMFAATAATIVSGAVAERVKLPVFMLFSMILVGFAYPITGSWKWGGGWLDQMGFYDFAGSSIVHAFGGFAALACAIILGPRTGKYTSSGSQTIAGHTCLGCNRRLLTMVGLVRPTADPHFRLTQRLSPTSSLPPASPPVPVRLLRSSHPTSCFHDLMSRWPSMASSLAWSVSLQGRTPLVKDHPS